KKEGRVGMTGLEVIECSTVDSIIYLDIIDISLGDRSIDTSTCDDDNKLALLELTLSLYP
ncbi:4475_t:CDS:1, partial [Funneliformis geosporum]